MFGSDLEGYARGVSRETPVSMHTFCAVLRLSEEVLAACKEVGQPASATLPLLQCLGNNLLVVSPLAEHPGHGTRPPHQGLCLGPFPPPLCPRAY